jgi:integrase
MNHDWFYRMLKWLGKWAGIPGLHPHMFRHTFSVRMIEEEVPLPTLEVM